MTNDVDVWETYGPNNYIIFKTKLHLGLKPYYTLEIILTLVAFVKMVVTIDLTFTTDRLRNLIQKSIRQPMDQNGYTIVLQDEPNLKWVKANLEKLLDENDIWDFVVAENTEKENEIAILKKGDIEQLGIYLCTHCGVSFESEIQRIVHQRIHYLG
jgi:hypothetical protein